MTISEDPPPPPWEGATHVITARVFGTRPHPISAGAYDELSNFAADLLGVLAIEEAYELMVQNYITLEKEMTSLLVGFMIQRQNSRSHYERPRREADRLLVNLLASGEMYTGHLFKTLTQRERAQKKVGGTTWAAVSDQARAALDAQQTKFLGFRAMEAMRNHVLHMSLPVAGWSQGNAWVEHEGQEVMRATYIVSLRPDALGGMRDLPTTLLAELEERSDGTGRVPWLPLVREYVEGLSNIQKAARAALAALESSALESIDRAVQSYRDATNIASDSDGMMAVAKVGSGWDLDDVRAIDIDFTERVDDLRSRNEAPMVNLHRRQLVWGP